jgi:predicted RNA-binding protein with PUA-like domain
MTQYWILKTEPGTYSFADLAREGMTRWDGIANPVARKHLRSMSPGDELMIYHTGSERRIVGMARVSSPPYTDPAVADPKATVVDIAAGPPLPRPVSLADVKADPRFADLGLVRQGRLSVVPVTPDQWQALLGLAGAG